MKVSPAAAAVPLLLLVLSPGCLSAQSTRMRNDLIARSKRSTVSRLMEIALHRDVLSARAGLLRNYDPLVREVNALRDALDRLRDVPPGDAEEAAAIDRFAAVGGPTGGA